jgi:hypothetical protein
LFFLSLCGAYRVWESFRHSIRCKTSTVNRIRGKTSTKATLGRLNIMSVWM